MDLKQLEHFAAVAEELHFTRASRRLNLVQSGLSASIRSLEEDLGGPLFIRSTRRVDLTPAGEVLFDEARRVLTAARAARHATAMVISGTGGMQFMGDWAKGEFANANKKPDVDYILPVRKLFDR